MMIPLLVGISVGLSEFWIVNCYGALKCTSPIVLFSVVTHILYPFLSCHLTVPIARAILTLLVFSSPHKLLLFLLIFYQSFQRGVHMDGIYTYGCNWQVGDISKFVVIWVENMHATFFLKYEHTLYFFNVLLEFKSVVASYWTKCFYVLIYAFLHYFF